MMNLTLLTLLATGASRQHMDFRRRHQGGSRRDTMCRPAQVMFTRSDLDMQPLDLVDLNLVDIDLATTDSVDWPIRDGAWYYNKWSDQETRLGAANASPETPSGVWADRIPAPLPHIPEVQVWMALEEGAKDYRKMVVERESLLKPKGAMVGLKKAPYHAHRRSYAKLQSHDAQHSRRNYVKEFATKVIVNKFDLKSAAVDMPFLGYPEARCEIRPVSGSCNGNSPFRTADGTCNNLADPVLGASFTPFRRLAVPDYADGVSDLKVAQNGNALPSARLVSTSINLPERNQNKGNCFTLLHMTFGQFLDHDLTLTPINTESDGSAIDCCTGQQNSECAPITVPSNDPFYSQFGVTCLNFVRSEAAETCTTGPREQLNALTHYIDLSQVYGSTEEETDSLRAHTGGLLLSQDQGGDPDLLPTNMEDDDGCNEADRIAEGQYCFRAGDERVNEQILLTLLHTTWMREHNRIADSLRQLNPNWDDERLFQEARRITIAEWQHIIYNEFLPGVLGLKYVRSRGLTPQFNGRFTNDYDSSLSAAISNEFSTAAFRFGHSMVPDEINQVNSGSGTLERELNSVLLAPFPLYEDGVEEGLVRGETSQRAMKVDTSFSQEITGELFQGDMPYGEDLVALNLQRGRDHGLADYVTVRQACGLGRIRSFNQLNRVMDRAALQRIRNTYRRVEDIELFVGGLSEKPVRGGQVGPTFACIFSDQFLRLKRGDRFWYEYSGSPNPFTPAQLRELHQVTMARVLCDNHPSPGSIQRWPLALPSQSNRKVSCSSTRAIPSLDLRLWDQ